MEIKERKFPTWDIKRRVVHIVSSFATKEYNRKVFESTNIKVRQKCWYFRSLDQQVLVKA